ncbi:MAG: metabolite traffic protein EboE [Burkholderiales bacterium]
MRIGADGAHLTYCSNIHPGESWAAVRSNLERYFTAVHKRVAPGSDFGVGLRLSAQAARELAEPGALDELRDFLRRERLYVFTINGFPYGTFHDTRVKEAVYLPDWRDGERLRYTNQLADLLAQLLPQQPGLEGSVSTVPCAYKPEVSGEADVERMADNLLRHVAHLIELERATGRRIALAIEPEPHCYLETVDESVGFFKRHLFSARGVRRLGELVGIDRQGAAVALQEHIGLCLDLCHAAVEFEDPSDCPRRLDEAGIRVHKLQISAGLRLPELTPQALEVLRRFDDAVYLHQVVESSPAGLRRFADLPEAFAALNGGPREREWRVHFHVPIFLDRLEAFSSTQFFIRSVLKLHRGQPITRHLEVETYTWNVLPDSLRTAAIEDAVARELNWVREELKA